MSGPQGNQTEQKPINFEALHQAQAAYCKERGYPHFAPRRCYDCRREIYSHPRAQAEAASYHITGCYHCHYSFCE